MSKNYLDKDGLSYFWGKVNTKLGTKANTSDLATVATSGSYNDLTDKSNSKIFYGTCATSASTIEKVVVCDSFTSSDLIEGVCVRVKFTNSSAKSNPTLNVNNTGAIQIIVRDGITNARYYWSAGEVIDFVYDGTYYNITRSGPCSTSYYGLAKLQQSATSTSSAYALTPGSLNAIAQHMIAGAEVYSASNTYNVGDLVRYSYSIYKCTTAIPTAEAWNAEHWEELPALLDMINDKQDTLVSGTNIKTINNTSLLGSGNIVLSADDEIAISTTQPTGNETVWVKSDETTNQARYKDGNTWKELSIKALDGMPIGSIILFAGETIPTGWLLCDGEKYYAGINGVGTEYPELFSVIGFTYGNYKGDEFYRVPDLKGRVGVGLDTTQTEFDTLGETGGSKELQQHSHTMNGSLGYKESSSTSKYSVGWDYVRPNTGIFTDSAGTGDSGNLQPYLVVNYIIKATNTTPTMASVVNATNNSTTDTYSCDYSNKHYGGVVLYSDDNGTTGNITLDDSSVNYSYIDIQFKGNNGSYDITRVYSPNGKAVNLFSANSDGTYIWQQVQVVNIVGTNITRASAYEWRLNSPSTINVYPTNVYITKVVGYK